MIVMLQVAWRLPWLLVFACGFVLMKTAMFFGWYANLRWPRGAVPLFGEMKQVDDSCHLRKQGRG